MSKKSPCGPFTGAALIPPEATTVVRECDPRVVGNLLERDRVVEVGDPQSDASRHGAPVGI